MIYTAKNQGEDRRRGGPTDTTADSGIHCPDSSGEPKVCSTLLILRSGAENVQGFQHDKVAVFYAMFVDAVGAKQLCVSVSASHKITHYFVNHH